MSTLVLDAGALIAIERHDRSIWAVLHEVRERGTETVVPATVLAQTWRGGPRSAAIAKLLEASTLDVLGETRAKEVGIRLGERRGSDVSDAHVVCCAVGRDAVIVTSDPEDIAALGGEDLSLIAL